jgi:hypothetical protein
MQTLKTKSSSYSPDHKYKTYKPNENLVPEGHVKIVTANSYGLKLIYSANIQCHTHNRLYSIGKKYLLPVAKKIKQFSTVYLKVAKPQFKFLISVNRPVQLSNKVICSSEW